MKMQQIVYIFVAIGYAALGILWKIYSRVYEVEHLKQIMLTIMTIYGFLVLQYAYYYFWVMAQSFDAYFQHHEMRFPICQVKSAILFMIICMTIRTIKLTMKLTTDLVKFWISDLIYNSPIGFYQTSHYLNLGMIYTIYYLADIDFDQSNQESNYNESPSRNRIN